MEPSEAQALPADAVSRLYGGQSDSTGSDTFSRYRWQAKQTVRQWLSTLNSENGLIAVVCEKVDDLVLVTAKSLRFAQLKTRDKGSWTADLVSSKGHGLDALIRTFYFAKEAGLVPVSYFELWLEGPMGESPVTVGFFADPSRCTAAMKARLRKLGLKKEDEEEFLSRLSLHPQQPSRRYIDAVILHLISGTWPGLTLPEREALYERLLAAAEAAQEGTEAPWSVRTVLSGLMSSPPKGDTTRTEVLHRSTLLALCPALPSQNGEDLLVTFGSDDRRSLLELKLRAAGASETTVASAMEARAESAVKRLRAMASSDGAVERLNQVSKNLLVMAQATAQNVQGHALVNPAASARPAEAITSSLLMRPESLLAVDQHEVFGGDPHLVYGHLCHLADECKFSWRYP